ncbi:MAG: DUF1566 domain-containing protein [Candidatus Binatia bacterium]
MPRSVLPALVAVFLALVASVSHAGPPPAWDKRIDKGATRFKVLDKLDGAAVLDKETGLVWELAPSSSLFDWASSQNLCVGAVIGGRRGWRLPTAWELMTLSDPSQNNPSLTAGHPFQNVSIDDNYWSSTPDAENPANALRERFGTGGGGIILAPKTDAARRWCVRGPGGQYGQ